SGTSRSSWSAPMAPCSRGSGRRSRRTTRSWSPPSRRTSPVRTRLGQGPRAALDHLAGDDRALDLAGALPDPLDPELAVEALGHVLAHVAAAAEDLHRAVGDPPGHLRAVELGHRALGVSDLDVAAPVDAAGGLVGEGPGREQLGE